MPFISKRFYLILCATTHLFCITAPTNASILGTIYDLEWEAEEALKQELVSLPEALENIPYGEDIGVVTGVKTISLQGITAPYNASIIEGTDGEYLLFFRQDIPIRPPAPGPFYTYVGVVKLDSAFEQKEEACVVETGSTFSEDPRVTKVGNEYYLSFNDLVLIEKYYCRIIRVGRWNPNTFQMDFITDLDQEFKPVEKNWMPFESHINGRPTLHFVYSMTPHKIFHLPDPEMNFMHSLGYSRSKTTPRLPWLSKWGEPRGGTPAKIVDGEYLAFFHSSFKDKKKVWYVMGAYTFETQHPFRITSISRFPIIFKEIYTAPHIHTANPNVNNIFPSGYVVEKKDGKTLLHVSCGDNDAAVKIITIDKKALEKTMTKINHSETPQLQKIQ